MDHIHTPKTYLDEIAMRWLGKTFDEVDKREFAKAWVKDYQERHKDCTEEVCVAYGKKIPL